MKRSTQLFLASFAITLILTLLVCGFVAVDQSTSRYGFGEFKPIFSVQPRDDLHYEITWFGKDYILSLDIFNIAAKYRHEYSFLSSAPQRLARQLVTLSIETYQEQQERRLEEEFIQNVLDDIQNEKQP